MSDSSKLPVANFTRIELLCRRCDATFLVPLGGDLKPLRREKLECENCGKLLAIDSEHKKIMALAELLADLSHNTIGQADLRISAS